MSETAPSAKPSSDPAFSAPPAQATSSSPPAASVLPKIRKPLGRTLGVGAVLGALVPLLVTAALLLDVNANAIKADASRLHAAVTDGLARVLNDTFANVERELQAASAALVDRARTQEERVAVAQALIGASPHLEAVAIYNGSGERLDVLRTSALELPFADTLPDNVDQSPSAPKVQRTGTQAIDNEPPRIQVAVPIVSDGQRTGTLLGWFSLGPVQAQVERLAALSMPGYADAIFVADSEGRFVAHATPSRAFGLESARSEPLVAGVTLSANENSQFAIQSEAVRADGTEVVGATLTLQGLAQGMVVVAQMPRSVVYASLRTMRVTAGAVVVVAAILAILAALLLARSMTGPIARLVDKAGALARRDFAAVRVPDKVSARQDELGVLGAAIAGAAQQLDESEAALLTETRLREGLGRYLPNQLVDLYVNNRQEDVLAGKRATVSVLFADVVGFTPMSAKLEPEKMCALLNDLFTILTEIVFKHGGTVDKFVGDSVMAFWGAPEEEPEHAAKAIEAARDMLRFLDVGNLRWKKRYDVEIRLAIGINTGEVVVGNLGSEKRLVYTAIGEAVNIAARLESVAGPMQILASRTTVDAANELEGAIPLGPQTLTGVDEPIDVYVIEI